MVSSNKGIVKIEGDKEELLVDATLLLCGLLEGKIISKDELTKLAETVVDMSDKIKPDEFIEGKRSKSNNDDLFRDLFFGGK